VLDLVRSRDDRRVVQSIIGIAEQFGLRTIAESVEDAPTLDLLRSYRAGLDTTEPLAFGVYGEVLEPGRVAVGDAVIAR